MDAKYNIYLNDGNDKKTVTLTKPKVTASADDFAAAGAAAQKAYALDYVNTGLASETIVHKAPEP